MLILAMRNCPSLAIVATIAFTLMAPPVFAQHASGRRAGHPAKTRPLVDLSQPNESTDMFRDVTSTLNAWYDQYNSSKTRIQNDYNIQYSMPVSTYGQWGMPNGGPSVAELVYSPSITWNPFTNTSIGSGSITFAVQGNQFWSSANTNSQQAAMGLLAAPNDWGLDSFQFAQLTYTHTFPGKVLAASIGQYSIGQFDGNQYAGNPQTNFISYPLAQNGTQTYANAGLGTYLQITPNNEFAFAGGFQDGADINGNTINAAGFVTGKYGYFLNGQWTPPILAGGTYSLLFYQQQAVPLQPSSSAGFSFSAAQMVTKAWGVFLRVNNASGQAISISTSVAGGAVRNAPFGRNQLDQLGLGIAWDRTNQQVTGTPSRPAEWVGESYYNFTIFKALQVGPDIQVYVSPALAPSTNVAAVFSLRATFSF